MDNLLIYKDKQMLVVNKPAGIMVEPDRFGNPNLLDQMKQYLQEEEKLKEVFLQNVHRLDKLVSGVILFARKPLILKQLNQIFADRKITKKYYAVTLNSPTKNKGVLTHYLMKNEKQKKSIIFEQPLDKAQLVKLKYEIIAQNDGKYLWDIHLLTGKFHQIRAQLAHIGCPIWGDELYGSTPFFQPNAIALHAYQLSFQHPQTQESINFSAPNPFENYVHS